MANRPGFVLGFLGALCVLTVDPPASWAATGDGTAVKRLVVRTYDNAGLASFERPIATNEASAILRDAGLELAWRDCRVGCAEALGRDEIVVRLVTAPATAAPGSLGYALVDLEQGKGTLATVYLDRIRSIARRTGVDAGRLIGRAIAHEIGHLLLGTSRHSAAGLMRARWSDREVKRDVETDWSLKSEVSRFKSETSRLKSDPIR
jgi:hypothetical protein